MTTSGSSDEHGPNGADKQEPEDLKPYDEITKTDWEEALRALPWTTDLDDKKEIRAWILDHPCPWCHHDGGIEVEHAAHDIITDLRSAAANTVTFFKYVQCVCDHDHPGRPDGESGCGKRVEEIQFTVEVKEA